MKLVDMEREPIQMEAAPIAAEPFYPCSLSLMLDMEALEALGIDDMPNAGTEFHLEAMGVITHSSTSDPDADGDVDSCCLSLQVTHLGLEHEKEPPLRDTDKDRAARMYGPREG
jgi:hypothetical protein